ncbi:MAG: 2-dehydropantoate 2-reductase [Opitutales bacterium]|nr:2-dehydropantoate 2-reductase [Opitutales bacterium]
MRIGIVGVGAIGGFYGVKLALSGADVHFLLRSDYDSVCKNGLEIREPENRSFRINPNAYREASEIGHCDLILIALKTTANSVMCDLAAPLVGPDSVVLTLQNGMGNTEILAGCFGGDRVLTGQCFVTLNRIAPGVIENYSPGKITVGSMVEGEARDRMPAIVDVFNRAGVPCSIADHLDDLLWKKLLWNVPFNGLAVAAGGIPTDRILASPALLAETRALMEEIRIGAAAFGVEIPARMIDRQIDATFPMGAYRPSTLIDFLEGRPMEVEAIWGEPLRRARSRGILMPRLSLLYALLSSL